MTKISESKKLFHFTTLDNAKSILNGNQLWFNNAASSSYNIQYEVYPLLIYLHTLIVSNHNLIKKLMDIGCLKIDLNSKKEIFDFCHEIIKDRYKSYILCFTESNNYNISSKCVQLEFSINGIEYMSGLLTQGSSRQTFLTFQKVFYDGDELINSLITKITNHEQIVNHGGFENVDDEYLLTNLRSASDFFKDESFSSEMEWRLLLYSASQPDMKNLPASLNSMTDVSKNISWNSDKELPQLQIYNSKVKNFLTKIICSSEKDAKEIKKETSTTCPIYIRDDAGIIWVY